jgi:hypothetical protein
MKRTLSILCAISLLACSGCGNYGESYDHGYADGVTEALDNQALDYVRDNYTINEIFSDDEIRTYCNENYSPLDVYNEDDLIEIVESMQ